MKAKNSDFYLAMPDASSGFSIFSKKEYKDPDGIFDLDGAYSQIGYAIVLIDEEGMKDSFIEVIAFLDSSALQEIDLPSLKIQIRDVVREKFTRNDSIILRHKSIDSLMDWSKEELLE